MAFLWLINGGDPNYLRSSCEPILQVAATGHDHRKRFPIARPWAPKFSRVLGDGLQLGVSEVDVSNKTFLKTKIASWKMFMFNRKYRNTS